MDAASCSVGVLTVRARRVCITALRRGFRILANRPEENYTWNSSERRTTTLSFLLPTPETKSRQPPKAYSPCPTPHPASV